jgi:hypothetical protein
MSPDRVPFVPAHAIERGLEQAGWTAVMNVMRQAGWVFTFNRSRMHIVAPDGEDWGELIGLGVSAAFFKGALAWSGTTKC